MKSLTLRNRNNKTIVMQQSNEFLIAKRAKII